REVVVDVVIVEDGLFGRQAGLPGPEDDANRPGELGADVLAQTQAGIFALHDDVEDGDVEIGVVLQHLSRLLLGVRAGELETTLSPLLGPQHQRGDAVDVLLVVYEQYFPNVHDRAPACLATTARTLRI